MGVTVKSDKADDAAVTAAANAERNLRNRLLSNRKDCSDNEAGRNKLQLFAPLYLSLLDEEEEEEDDYGAEGAEEDERITAASLASSLWERLFLQEEVEDEVDDDVDFDEGDDRNRRHRRRLVLSLEAIDSLQRTTKYLTLQPIYRACDSELCEAYHTMLFFSHLAATATASNPLAMLAAGGSDVLLPRIGEYVGAVYEGVNLASIKRQPHRYFLDAENILEALPRFPLFFLRFDCQKPGRNARNR